MSINTRKIEEAIGLIEDARYLVNQVLRNGALKGFQISKEYYAYGEWGLKQAVGEGNPFDGKLQDIIDKLEEEGL